jgi:tryptophan halogenase
MHIVIVGGGTAGWMTALLASNRHPNHKITLVESSNIGIIGVGESTTGLLTDLLGNHLWDFGCDHNEFIRETGASLKYGIKFKGWTPDIDDYYIGPIDGSITKQHTPDIQFAHGIKNLSRKDIIKVSRIGNWIAKGKSNFNKTTNDFSNMTHAMHVDAHLVGKYFQKITMRNSNITHIDAKVIDAELDDKGFIKNIVLEDNTKVQGDFFIDCSGMSRLLMKKMPANGWVSYHDNLPVNSAIPFLLDYQEGEIPEPYTTAWAQNSGWMWQIPLLDRKGCGYVFDDNFITPDEAQAEIEARLGRKINPAKVIKFSTGRQESAWINNCVTIGLASAFLEPLEATSIHSTVVQIKNFVFDYLRDTTEETINQGSINIYNQRTRKMFDDLKDFIAMHYCGGRTDTEFWRYINTGVTKTEFVTNLIEMAKYRMPTHHDFPSYYGSAGWPLYSYIMEGLHLINKDVATKELQMPIPGIDNLEDAVKNDYVGHHEQWHEELTDQYSWAEMIAKFREDRKKLI